MENWKMLLTTLIVTLVMVFGLSWLANNWLSSSPVSGTELAVPVEELVGENPHVLGNSSATNTLVVFSDFLCPACRSVEPILQSYALQNPDQVKLIFRHFPLQGLHPTTMFLASLTEAAALQGQFWEMHTLLFSMQVQLSELNEADIRQVVLAAVNDLPENNSLKQLNLEKFQQDFDSEGVKNAVNEDLRQAELLQLHYTPSIFLNGELMQIDQVQFELETLLKQE